jgi:hypothetical protein
MDSEKVRENQLRRWAGRLGYELRKDRARRSGINNQGGYMIVDTNLNAVVHGANFDESLDEVEVFLTETEAALRTP